MPRPQKRILVSARVRRIRRGLGFSWVDRRFLRDGWIDRLARDEILLYFFLVAVADKDGLSYYSDARTTGTLRISRSDLERARSRLVDLGLVAYQPPLYQVLSLDVPAHPRADCPRTLREILRDL